MTMTPEKAAFAKGLSTIVSALPVAIIIIGVLTIAIGLVVLLGFVKLIIWVGAAL